MATVVTGDKVDANSIELNGSTSGAVTIQAPAVAGTTSITLPAVSGGDFVVSDSSGNVGIGTSSPSSRLNVSGSSEQTSAPTDAGTKESTILVMGGSEGTDSGGTVAFGAFGKTFAAIKGAIWDGNNNGNGDLCFSTRTATTDTSLTERLRISRSGLVQVGTTNANPAQNNVTGIVLNSIGYVSISRDNLPVDVNRVSTDGTIVSFRQDGVIEGTIATSGTTVTYNSFAGSHWSQLSDNSRPEILRGTVVDTIDEKCEWLGEENDQLAKFKISDTVSSKRVYGVFMSWDNDDEENNDAYITGVGAYLIRIASGVTVNGGDLLDSNGDGCAKVQSDDIIRSSTIGKVTCNIPVDTYDDGSYTVPCVLYCG